MGEKYMMIDGKKTPFNEEKNILDVVRKAGIELPTFCYYSELSIYGACRMCVVENEWGGIIASCSTPPKHEMAVKTNTLKLQKYRKMILELILSSHCRDCTTCSKNGQCRLQSLAVKFGIERVRFDGGTAIKNKHAIDSSDAIVRDPNKCILCGDCVRMCEEVQHVGAIDFAFRGSDMRVTTAFEAPIGETNCVHCGQCSAVCPTGAILVKNDSDSVWQHLADPTKRVVVQIAPAVRVGLGEAFGLPVGENVMGKIVSALNALGFDEVYDTSIGADLTVMEESKEMLKRLEVADNLPMFTSCCPAWVQFAEKKYPHLLKSLSTCKSPMQMFGAVLKDHFHNVQAVDGKELVSVAIMPCTAKKFESKREAFKQDEIKDVDYVLTTQELVAMIKKSGLVFDQLDYQSTNMPFGLVSGAGVLFGVTGGVTEAVIRRISTDKSADMMDTIAFTGIRGMDGAKHAKVKVGEREVNIAVVHGLGNADDLIKKMEAGEANFDFVEVMACPGGCIAGAGQPFARDINIKAKRADGIYQADKMAQVKRSEENPMMQTLYGGVLKGKIHERLHVAYE
jgi:NADH-quinone oxidoreductase subunit G